MEQNTIGFLINTFKHILNLESWFRTSMRFEGMHTCVYLTIIVSAKCVYTRASDNIISCFVY